MHWSGTLGDSGKHAISVSEGVLEQAATPIYERSEYTLAPARYSEGADLLVPGGLVSMAFGVFVQRVHGAWPTAVRKSVFGPICAATGAPKDHFGCQKATKKCKKRRTFGKTSEVDLDW